jgi:hypothetical protein
MRCTVCVGTFPNLGTPTLNSLNSSRTARTALWVLPVFFVQVPVSATRFSILTMLDHWGAQVAGARCNCTCRARARHADADLGHLSTPHLRTARCTAARSSHTVAFANAGAMQVTTPSWRIVTRARAIADGSREPEYAPPTNRHLHTCRALLSHRCVCQGMCHLASH